MKTGLGDSWINFSPAGVVQAMKIAGLMPDFQSMKTLFPSQVSCNCGKQYTFGLQIHQFEAFFIGIIDTDTSKILYRFYLGCLKKQLLLLEVKSHQISPSPYSKYSLVPIRSHISINMYASKYHGSIKDPAMKGTCNRCKVASIGGAPGSAKN